MLRPRSGERSYVVPRSGERSYVVPRSGERSYVVPRSGERSALKSALQRAILTLFRAKWRRRAVPRPNSTTAFRVIFDVYRFGTENVDLSYGRYVVFSQAKGQAMSWTITRPVVVPFDFSEYSIQAVRKAIEIAGDSSLVRCLHVLPFITPTEPGVVWGLVDDEERLKHALESMQQQLPERDFGKLQIDVRLGDPGSVVADRAKELDAELIVIGSHGRSGIARLMLGSVAERVVRLASCPVLVVKLHPQPVKAAVEAKRETPQVAIA